MSTALAAQAGVQALGDYSKYKTQKQIEMTKQTEFSPVGKWERFWKSLTPKQRGLLITVGVGGALFGAYKGYKAYQKYQETKGAREEIKKMERDLKALAKKGIKPTSSDSQFQTWANQLKEAFDGCGTTTSVVKDIIGKLNNDADFLMLSKSFGVATFDKCGLGTGDYTGSLSQSVTYKLGSDVADINNLLKKHGLNKRF